MFALCFPQPAQAYIGPGAGFAVLGSFLVVLAAIALAVIILITWPVRFLLRALRRRRSYGSSSVGRVIILGFDGMDPEIAEKMMATGRLPNLKKLSETGTYSHLATSCPAMSPVAWSSFMTGAGPGRHGIFDFLHRDPRTYLPDLSSAHIGPPRRVLRLGRLYIPLSRPSIRLLRRSKPFWSVLGEHGVFSTVLRVPITFPPERFNGLLLSGMCVPDLRGTQGSFTFFTSADEQHAEHIGGQQSRLKEEKGVFHGVLPGPPRAGSSEGEAAELPFTFRPNGDGSGRLDISGERVELKEGEHSEWVPLSFSLGPGMRASGICLFYLKQSTPEVELYASPINIDPERAALPVSHPAVYSLYLSKRQGRFATLGLAEDTWALNEGVLNDSAFLEQCRLFCEEREEMLFSSLANTRHGCLVCVFDTTDRVQHMYWRYRDEQSPAPVEEDTAPFREAIEASYEQADAVVGKVLSQLKERDALFVMSDHGFKPFRRGVNLNSWLLQNGYLQLKPGASGKAEWLRNVDWSRTRAYAIGLAGIYLNITGREAEGIVNPREAKALREELSKKLTGLRDEEKNTVAIERVFDTATAAAGPYADQGPDLIIGYAPGYRASWDAAQGKVTEFVMEDNTRRWSGDHCLDPRRVPGVLFSNHRLKASSASIMDIAPTVLDLFGIQVPGYMQGRSLLSDDEEETSTHV
ncbi:MAG: nucleotide pyrophosphatase [Armatimonadetes bacterium]|nr:nucleotide pyrophosphatase [Armatimonadota bacterium]NIM24415.1 nucleotide pyrophosphatase [Armatimonadota bacterium]NIM68286.1 nucleotide pyrophosphatase [Armatimonadota bacterium]NIM76690.1 nucleotide pyrophosphatase [Armatimonadota bacterium]NIN06489.1 nucleotide pyrophosphatase [Armatimonadota bacterium]